MQFLQWLFCIDVNALSAAVAEFFVVLSSSVSVVLNMQLFQCAGGECDS